MDIGGESELHKHKIHFEKLETDPVSKALRRVKDRLRRKKRILK